MNKALIFAAYIIVACAVNAHAATSRNANATVRQGSVSQRVTTTEKAATPRAATLAPRSATQSVSGRTAANGASAVKSRAATTKSTVSRNTTTTSAAVSRATTARSAIGASATARAAIDESSEAFAATRTGAAYEQCKSAFFTCMDQFCTLKNDDYRRCSCSNRVYSLAESRQSIQDAGEQLTVFTENLNVVGMTAAQATAMKTASEGENALTADASASKALLQAIMNSIRGEDSSVGGKYTELNSINLSFDTSNAFGMTDAGQAIAKHNGQNLYTAVYPQCRAAVKADCTDAALQRAITAYLMAIEQDCNTLETAILNKKKELKAGIREGSAMLDLARVENRQNHNSSDIATCVAEVESAVLSEEVCGAGYHKCLDNGEYIDLSTGAPIAGVIEFYKLGELLQFADGVAPVDQKLTRAPANRTFVQNFEKRVKKFAQPALDKCVEHADEAWADYLDKAMLDIYYAQNAKVDEIKQGCFDFVSACYMNGDTSITAAMKNLTGDSNVILQPAKIALNNALCSDYVRSCNNMFDGDIVQAYIENRQDTDTNTACRAIVKQCFDKYGGTNYENFYYPYSGLFNAGEALDWFTLYELQDTPTDDQSKISLTAEYPLMVKISVDKGPITTKNGQLDQYKSYIYAAAKYKSECAKQLTKINACNNQQTIEQAFGGLDIFSKSQYFDTIEGRVYYVCAEIEGGKQFCTDPNKATLPIYGHGLTYKGVTLTNNHGDYNSFFVQHRNLRPTGVATETYNQIVDILATQCQNVSGRFMEYQFVKRDIYGKDGSLCHIDLDTKPYSGANGLLELYAVGKYENMCPRDYETSVDTKSWGACLCWENGGRRSKWGKSAKCVAAFPVTEEANDAACQSTTDTGATKEYTKLNLSDSNTKFDKNFSEDQWCTVDPSNKTENQVWWPGTTQAPTYLPEAFEL